MDLSVNIKYVNTYFIKILKAQNISLSYLEFLKYIQSVLISIFSSDKTFLFFLKYNARRLKPLHTFEF